MGPVGWTALKPSLLHSPRPHQPPELEVLLEPDWKYLLLLRGAHVGGLPRFIKALFHILWDTVFVYHISLSFYLFIFFLLSQLVLCGFLGVIFLFAAEPHPLTHGPKMMLFCVGSAATKNLTSLAHLH